MEEEGEEKVEEEGGEKVEEEVEEKVEEEGLTRVALDMSRLESSLSRLA